MTNQSIGSNVPLWWFCALSSCLYPSPNLLLHTHQHPPYLHRRCLFFYSVSPHPSGPKLCIINQQINVFKEDLEPTCLVFTLPLVSSAAFRKTNLSGVTQSHCCLSPPPDTTRCEIKSINFYLQSVKLHPQGFAQSKRKTKRIPPKRVWNYSGRVWDRPGRVTCTIYADNTPIFCPATVSTKSGEIMYSHFRKRKTCIDISFV